MKALLIATCAALALTAPALAQQPPTDSSSGQRDRPSASPATPGQDQASKSASQMGSGKAFASADGDANGSISLKELKMLDSKLTAADLAKFDMDKNQRLSSAEYTQWQSSHGAKGSNGSTSKSPESNGAGSVGSSPQPGSSSSSGSDSHTTPGSTGSAPTPVP